VPGAALLSGSSKALAANGRQQLNPGDVAILQLLAAAELIEADLWQQYKELGGVDAPDSGYKAGLVILDGDQPQYIADNTDDELSHAAFLNAYLRSKGEQQLNLGQFANLPPSQVSFVPQTGRLTNLKQITVDTSWWTRYRSTTNPDFGATFPNAVPSLDIGLHTAIPRNDNELGDPNNPSDHVKAIAFTAGFHFGYIEQGGTSLYATLAQKVTSLEVLRILLSIGGSEIMHFQTWQDKAGNATPLTDFDPINNSTVTFIDLTTGQPETLQANLIMPEPCEFIRRSLPACSIIRPTGPGQLDATGCYKQLHCRRAFQGTTASVHAGNYFSGSPGGRGRKRTPRLMELRGPARRAPGRRLSTAFSQRQASKISNCIAGTAGDYRAGRPLILKISGIKSREISKHR
jgi:hypothetical protein